VRRVLIGTALVAGALMGLGIQPAWGGHLPTTGTPLLVPVRVGGLVRSVDAARHYIIVSSKAQHRFYTVVVSSQTKVTLSKWTADYADMRPGDHITAVGSPGDATASGSRTITATTIHLSSPSFGGVITAVSSQRADGVTVTVRARHGHLLLIDVPAGATVLYGAQTAQTQDLRAGMIIVARGVRVGKFALTATFIHVYPRRHTLGGKVTALSGGDFQVWDSAHGRGFVVLHTGQTVYTLGGKRASVAALHVGLHVRVRGVDALHPSPSGMAGLVAAHVSVLVPRHKAYRVKSLTFGGVVTALAPAAGYLTVSIRPTHGHVLHVAVRQGATVVYGVQSAGVRDLSIGQHILARGKRVGEYDLQGRFIHIYPRTLTAVGRVTSFTTGVYHLVDTTTGRYFIVRSTPRTSYTLNGKSAGPAVVTVGHGVSVRGYTALRTDQPGIATLIATRISTNTPAIHHKTPKGKKSGGKAAPAPTPRPH